MYTSLATALTIEGVRRSLDAHCIPATTTCVIAVAIGGRLKAVVDEFTIEGRTNRLIEMGGQPDNPHSAARWAIALVDTSGELRVLGQGRKVKAWARDNFYALSKGIDDSALEKLLQSACVS